MLESGKFLEFARIPKIGVDLTWNSDVLSPYYSFDRGWGLLQTNSIYRIGLPQHRLLQPEEQLSCAKLTMLISTTISHSVVIYT